MDVYFDERKAEITLEPKADLSDLVAELRRRCAETRRIIVGIQCDGLDVTGDDFAATLTKPLGDFSRVDVQSAEPRTLLTDALDTARALLEASEESVAEIVEALARGDARAAMPQLGDCCRAWLQVHEGVRNATAMLGLDENTLEVDGQPWPEVMAAPIELLNQLKEAVQVSDLVMLSDILSYEFPETIRIWQAALVVVEKNLTVFAG